MVPENIMMSLSDNGLMLQVIFFAIFFGLSLAIIPNETGKPVIDFINGINEVFLKMVDIVMKAAPFFVFALLAGVIAKMADTPAEVFEIFKGLWTYSLTLVLGLAFMVFIFYPLLITLFVKKLSYKEFFKNISPAQFLAFSTSSSAATLPVTMECVEENMGVSKNISSFVLPIGATVNMDGTSLYQAVAVVFLAQMHMVDLTFGQQLTIVFTATLASIGSAAVPSAGLVMMIIVLQSVGLNPAWIAIIFPVDRILDMCRTVVNVTGDASVSTLIAKSEGELPKYS
ncbi:dicarboxylate/amino acid:cation symporter [Fulvivirga maritima]|uniref:dicarboxylate/amino acid:cation symporter n=1 Tax=Fulvivirga maritima TaxID=2904247 RepID=UPI001F3541C6|nr:dicarboxylate/amino acid:cation symporter [Fulvivirga maritima]UII28550.1 dicarboxylate/amino acid:cation symporter [Fulvivirga maritima]